MRKALALIMVFAVFCCSVSATLSGGTEAALEGVSNGIAATIASHLSEPQVALQGVSISGGKGAIPSLVSFVRSDVSTYPGSLAFFGTGVSIDGYSSAATAAGQLLATDDIRQQLEKSRFAEGDLVLDGSLRLIEGGDFTISDLVSKDDWSGLYALMSMSIMVTGSLAGDGIVVEGSLILSGGNDRSMTIAAENLRINSEKISAGPIVLSFGE